MEMQQIRYYLALAETLNFTRAAEECHVTQPALTRAIQALEAELGGDLIRRERQQSHLTELGRSMLPLLQQCYNASVSAKSLARAVKTSAVAPLNVVVSNSVDLGVMTAILTELFRAYPGMRLKLKRGTPSDIVEILKRGEADLAVAGRLSEAWDRLDSWPIFSERLELLAPEDHPLVRGSDEIRIEALSGQPLFNRQLCETAETLSHVLREKGLEIDAAHAVECDWDLLALVSVQAGFGFLPQSSPKRPGIKVLKVTGLDVSRTVAVYAVAGRMRSPVVTAMLNMLRAADWTQSGFKEPS